MKKRLILLLVAALFLTIGVFTFRMNQRRWRTDPEPLIKFFPVFSDAEDCCWKAGNYDPLFSCPGPSSAWIKGYIKLPAATINQLRQDYSWTPTEGKPYQIECGPDYPLSDVQWLDCQNFSDDIMMPEFVGWVYLNDLYNVMYIYAEFA